MVEGVQQGPVLVGTFFMWDNQFALPLFVCLFCCQSVTLSAHHCTSLIHCTVCPVSTDFLSSTLVCPSLPSVAISQIRVCHLASPLPSTFTLTISGLFQVLVQ